MKKTNNKTILFLGILFMLMAFGCGLTVIYQIFEDHQQKVQEVKQIKEKVAKIDKEKASAQKEVQELAKRVGQEIELDRLVSVSKQEYGEEEKERREGDLWIDHKGGSWMVTLGVLNGVKKGTRLRVMDGNEKIGEVEAETVLDVVSYVSPLDDHGQYKEDIYHVVVE